MKHQSWQFEHRAHQQIREKYHFGTPRASWAPICFGSVVWCLAGIAGAVLLVFSEMH
jgi:hypothetical protein